MADLPPEFKKAADRWHKGEVVLPSASKEQISKLGDQIKALQKKLNQPTLTFDITPGGSAVSHDLVRDGAIGKAIQATAQLMGLKAAQLSAKNGKARRAFSASHAKGRQSVPSGRCDS